MVIKDTALCGLGQTSPNPVQSTLNNFWDEYVEHITDKKCRANKCKDLIHYFIDPENCTGCMACARKCPVNAIAGERKQVHVINQDLCTKCGICLETCKFNAVYII
jgi:Na+-translocating ferredoxin:NAD+ oxidoreductase RNF subunit RnfB